MFPIFHKMIWKMTGNSTGGVHLAAHRLYRQIQAEWLLYLSYKERQEDKPKKNCEMLQDNRIKYGEDKLR